MLYVYIIDLKLKTYKFYFRDRKKSATVAINYSYNIAVYSCIIWDLATQWEIASYWQFSWLPGSLNYRQLFLWQRKFTMNRILHTIFCRLIYKGKYYRSRLIFFIDKFKTRQLLFSLLKYLHTFEMTESLQWINMMYYFNCIDNYL